MKVLKRIILLFKVLLMVIFTLIMSIIAGISLFFKNPHNNYLFIGRIWARGILRLFKIKVTITGTEKIHLDTGILYMANHASMFDIFILMAYLPGQIRFLGKKELTRIPVFGWAWKYSGSISIDRKSPRAFLRSLEKAGETVKTGKCVIIYPEGTRTRDGKIQKFKRGSFPIAIKSEAVIVPVTINGSYKIQKKGSIIVNPGEIGLVVHDPFKPEYENMTREKQLITLERIKHTIESAYIDQSIPG